MDLYPLIGPTLRLLPPECAHRLTLKALAAGLGPRQYGPDEPMLASRVWGLDFSNPVGLAAGFDKDAEVATPMLRLGFGFVEVGSITPRPQSGNPRPRVFRLPSSGAIINRLGFNSAGHKTTATRLIHRPRGFGVLGVNLGANRDSDDPAADYAQGAALFAPLADYLVVNVSSPNTPGLRALQARAALAELLAGVRAAVDSATTGGGRPLLVKIAPDLAPDERQDIAEIVGAGGADGLIVSNTTIARPADLRGRRRNEAGGLSGRPLFGPSTEVLADMYRRTGGKVPLVGVGGIVSAADAYAKIRAGASLVQLYTALVYQGPGLVRRIKTDLAARLRADGFSSVVEAVGADHK